MKVEQVIRALLVSNVACVDSGGGLFFQVAVDVVEDGVPAAAGSASGPYRILLQDLLEAPRQMPLECLVSDASEEWEPYGAREPGQELLGRLPWLMGLMVFLTVSSAILEFYDGVLQRHLAIAFY